MKTFNIKLFIYNILYFLGKSWAFLTNKNKRPIVLKFAKIKTSRQDKRANQRYIDSVTEKMINRSAKKFLTFAVVLFFIAIGFGCKQDAVNPQASALVQPTVSDTMVKFTLYSKRVPFIWRYQANSVWVQDTIKTNNAIRYEIFDNRNASSGVGYFVTMNLAGISTDSLHIIGEYKGKLSQMASPKGQSAAYVVLNAIGPK